MTAVTARVDAIERLGGEFKIQTFTLWLHTYDSSRDRSVICAHTIHVSGIDPIAFARRILKLDQMYTDPVGYTRIEVCRGHYTSNLLQTVRLSKRTKEKWSMLSAIARGGPWCPRCGRSVGPPRMPHDQTRCRKRRDR